MSASAKSLGLWACTALVVGNMIGSGVFALPASLAPFGGIAVGGWLITSVGSIALALVFGRLARLVPATGGPYAYTRAGFGDFAGFLVAWGYWITLWSGNAAVAVALSGYLAYFVPLLRAQPLAGLAGALAAIWLVTWINVRGVKEAGAFQMVTTVLKLVPLLLVATVGLAYVEPGHFVPLNTSGQSTLGALAACSALTLWAFLGLELATVPAGNVERPEVTIPRATVLGTVFAALLYIMVTVAAFGVVPLGELAHTTAPLADAAERLFGPSGRKLCRPWCGGLDDRHTQRASRSSAGRYRSVRLGTRCSRRALASCRRKARPAFALVVSNLLASATRGVELHQGARAPRSPSSPCSRPSRHLYPTPSAPWSS